MKKLALCSLVLLLLSPLGCGGGGNKGGDELTAAPQYNQTSTEQFSGANIFQAKCSSCHPNGGNTIDPNLPLKGAPQLASFSSFLNFIRNPRMPNGSIGAMPAFTPESLSDAQAEALYRFVDSAYEAQGAERGSAVVRPTGVEGVYCPYCGRFLPGFRPPQ